MITLRDVLLFGFGLALIATLSLLGAGSPDVGADAGSVSERRAYYTESVTRHGPQRAYASFLEEQPSHNDAHLFGEALYETEGRSGVRACDAAIEFGCFHGFLSKAVRAEGLAVVPALDAECFASGALPMPCQHGIGHGILEFMGHGELVAALAECEKTNRLDPIGGCTSGVFMEYNVPLSEGASGALVTQVRALADEAHPYDPCPEVGDAFRLSCYHELPQWWEQVLPGYERMGLLCAAVADADEQQACFSGIGNLLPQSLAFDRGRIEETCRSMPSEEGRIMCTLAAIWVYPRDAGRDEDARALCASVPSARQGHCGL